MSVVKRKRLKVLRKEVCMYIPNLVRQAGRLGSPGVGRKEHAQLLAHPSHPWISIAPHVHTLDSLHPTAVAIFDLSSTCKHLFDLGLVPACPYPHPRAAFNASRPPPPSRTTGRRTLCPLGARTASINSEPESSSLLRTRASYSGQATGRGH